MNTTPSHLELQKIEKWLRDEKEEVGEGFYCNGSVIEEAFGNGKFITLELNAEPIGFLGWSKKGGFVEIELFEIKPDCRKQGMGNAFWKEASEHFKQMGILGVSLQCSPIYSEGFWQKMGFAKYSIKGEGEFSNRCFKPLVQTMLVTESVKAEHKLELWDVTPNDKIDVTPKWTWSFELSGDKLEFPIILPCSNKWNLRWTQNGKVIKEDAVNHFNPEEKPAYCNDFLIIEELIQ